MVLHTLEKTGFGDNRKDPILIETYRKDSKFGIKVRVNTSSLNSLGFIFANIITDL